MSKKLGLNHIEQQIMELLWKANGWLFYEELEGIIKAGFGRNWRIRKFHTCLDNLKKMDIIEADDSLKPAKYCAKCTKEELEAKWTREQIRKVLYSPYFPFGVFGGGKGLTKEEAEELKKFLN